MQTKKLKEETSAESPSFIENDSHWIRRVINNEQTKPLEVGIRSSEFSMCTLIPVCTHHLNHIGIEGLRVTT